MAYHLYSSDGTTVEYKEGQVPLITAGNPMVSLETLDSLERCAKEFLFDHPRSTVILAEGNRVIKSLRIAEDVRIAQYCGMAEALSAHCVLLGIFAVGSSVHFFGITGFFILVAISLLYEAMWRLGIQNRIESGLVCTILLILSMLMQSLR
jgi:hypothetical protein